MAVDYNIQNTKKVRVQYENFEDVITFKKNKIIVGNIKS